MQIKKFDSSFLNKNVLQGKRLYGIDLLKIIAMINVINLHIVGSSGLLRINPKHPKFKHAYRLEFFSYWPVNAFGLISGIVGFKKYKFSNLIYLWIENFYYSILFSILLYSKSLLDLKELILSFFPLGIQRFWYFNAYFFMYLTLPFITTSINSINNKLYTKLIICYFFFYSLYHTILHLIIKFNNFDTINNGYSSMWLITLYILGGYFARFYMNKIFFPNFCNLIIYIISSFISCEYIFYCIEKNKPYKSLMKYNSPTIIIQAISLIFFFKNLDINNKIIKKAILFFNPLNFNVALIHMRVFLFNTTIIKKLFEYIMLLSPKYLFFKIYSISILIYLLCSIFDYFRYLLFKLLKIRILCIYIENKIFNLN